MLVFYNFEIKCHKDDLDLKPTTLKVIREIVEEKITNSEVFGF